MSWPRLDEIFIIEKFDELNMREMPWSFDENAWWQDTGILFHGTHISNLDKISKGGLQAGHGAKGVGVYLALDPFTARGYAAMAGAGGERDFRRSKAVKSAPMSERAVIVVQLPSNMWDKFVTSKRDTRIYDHETWKKKGKGNPRYWELAEVMYPSNIPANYIKGYMVKS